MSTEFKRPQEAPVFFPTQKEFEDPLLYIKSIAPVAREYGICKIRPPRDWKPPFCIDRDKFSFFPRIQKLSDLSAFNRAKNDFVYDIVSFWEAQGVQLFTPYVKGVAVDVYKLWKSVQCLGGFDSVCKNKLWCDVASSIGFESNAHVAPVICLKYKKILLPYENFLRNQNEKLVFSNDFDNNHNETSTCVRRKLPIRRKPPSLRRLVCVVCGLGEKEDQLLICESCLAMGAHHTYCLQPALSDIPKTPWFCPKCLSQRFSRLQKNKVFGFKNSRKRRILSQFANSSDTFKSKHFGKPAYMVSLTEVEQEFWRLMNSESTDIVVEYGTDLCTADYGSGFPTRGNCTNRNRKYVESPWNLNNISVVKHSALRFLPKTVSGMIIPWCYVGMVFSCFCWHTEDHWSYSVNYLHCGSPKTWYGVPTDSAEAFENAIRSEVPELFQASPDLMHHITTMVNPSVAQSHGVPIYRLDQSAGEFVVTFPRAYHAGFNQGFNFAEAVNFCPADWFTLGRYSVEHYALHHRPPVFAHAELLCRMAQSEENLNVDFLVVVTDQLKELLSTERSLRRHLTRLGVRHAECMVFEQSEEEKRECKLCRTTLYLSALACKCSSDMVCLGHYQALDCCAHDDQMMRYRYGLDELSEFIDKLDTQLQDYRRWQDSVNRVTQLGQPGRTAGDLVKPKYVKPESGEDVSPSDPKPEETSTGYTEVTTAPIVERSGATQLTDTTFELAESSNDHLTLSEIQNLADVGRSRGYPQEEIVKIIQLIQTINDCAEVVRRLLTSYKSASVASAEASSVTKLMEDSFDSGCTSSSSDDTMVLSSSDRATDSSGAESLDEAYPKTRRTKTKCELLHTPTSTPSKVNASPKPTAKSPKKLSRRCALKRPSYESEDRKRMIEKISWDDFCYLYSKALRLKAFIPEWKEFRAMFEAIERWRNHVSCLLSYFDSIGPYDETEAPVHDSLTLSKLIGFADVILVQLPEAIPLQRLRERLAWVDIVDETLADNPTGAADSRTTSKPSLNYLRQLQCSPLGLSTAYVCIPGHETRLDQLLGAATERLSRVILTAVVHEEKLIAIRDDRDQMIPLEQARSILEEAEACPVSLPFLNEFRQNIEQAESIERQCEQISRLLHSIPLQSPLSPLDPRAFEGDLYEELALGTIDCTSGRWKSVIHSLAKQEENIRITCPRLGPLVEMIDFIDERRERLCKIFLLPHTEFSLLEVLLPRSAGALKMLVRCDSQMEGPSSPSTSSRRALRDDVFSAQVYAKLCKKNAEKFVHALVSCEDFFNLYDSLYCDLIETERSGIRHLRSSNHQKSRSRRQPQVAYCICRRPGFHEFMVQCELCRDWFHQHCVMLPELDESEAERLRYMCPRCERSLRPELPTLLTILNEVMEYLSMKSNPVGVGADAGHRDSRQRTERLIYLPRLPEFVAAQLLCERVFNFTRRLRTAMQSNHELSQMRRNYERFSGVQMPLVTCTENTYPQETNRKNDRTERGERLCSHPSDRRLSGSDLTHSQTRPPYDPHSRSGFEVVKTNPPGFVHDRNLICQEQVGTEIVAGTSVHSQSERMSVPVPSEQRHPESTTQPHRGRSAGPSWDSTRDRATLMVERQGFDPIQTQQLATSFRSSVLKAQQEAQLFHWNLSPEARKMLESLLMEAGLLEVSIPQTRWLWQLHLASDPDTTDTGAVHMLLARVEEKRLKRRFVRQLEHSGGPRNLFGTAKRSRVQRRDTFGNKPQEPVKNDAHSTSSDEFSLHQSSGLSPNPTEFSSGSVTRTQKKRRPMSHSSGCPQVNRRYERGRMQRRYGTLQTGRSRLATNRTTQRGTARPTRGMRREAITSRPKAKRLKVRGRINYGRAPPPIPLDSSGSLSSSELHLKEKKSAKRSRNVHDDTPCAAGSSCQRPASGLVQWIACDECDAWYHQICVGIRDVPENYICPPCSGPSPSSSTLAIQPLSPSAVTKRSSLREPTRRRSSLSSSSLQRPVGWNTQRSIRPTRDQSTLEGTEWADYSSSASSSGGGYVPADYNDLFLGDDPETGNKAVHMGELQQIEKSTTEAMKGSDPSPPPSDPTEVLLQAIDVVSATERHRVSDLA